MNGAAIERLSNELGSDSLSELFNPTFSSSHKQPSATLFSTEIRGITTYTCKRVQSRAVLCRV